MRLLLLAITCVLSGCATLPIDSSKVSIIVEPTAIICGASDSSIPVKLSLKNNSNGVLHLRIKSMREQPPYHLSWLNYNVLASEGDEIDWKHGPGGHGPLPVHTLHIGKGDSAQLVAHLYEIKPEDYTKSYRIRFSDTSDQNYFSEPFKACLLPKAA